MFLVSTRILSVKCLFVKLDITIEVFKVVENKMTKSRFGRRGPQKKEKFVVQRWRGLGSRGHVTRTDDHGENIFLVEGNIGSASIARF